MTVRPDTVRALAASRLRQECWQWRDIADALGYADADTAERAGRRVFDFLKDNTPERRSEPDLRAAGALVAHLCGFTWRELQRAGLGDRERLRERASRVAWRCGFDLSTGMRIDV